MGIKITKELVKYVYLNTPDKSTVKMELERYYDIMESNIREISSSRDLRLTKNDLDMLSDIFEVLYIRKDFSSDEILQLARKAEELKERLHRKKEYIRKKKNYNGVYIYA